MLSREQRSPPLTCWQHFPNTAQEAVGLCCKYTLLAYLNLEPPGLPQPFLQSCFPADQPQSILVHGVILSWVHNFVLHFVELHEVPVRPFVQPVEVHLDANTNSDLSPTPPSFVASANLLIRVHCAQSSSLLMKRLKCMGSRTTLRAQN